MVGDLVMLILGNQKILANVEGNESNGSNSKSRKGTFESVDSGERALVSPGLTKMRVRDMM